jgi:Flp pilus assembly protein CpaB
MQTIRKPTLNKGGKGPLSTKGGSIAAAILAAALAATVIVIFLQQYRSSVNNDGVPTAVIVADQLIEQGASGDSIGAQKLFRSTKVPRDQLKPHAVTDAAALRGKVAVADILPGQQLTSADFKPAGRGVVTKLAADQRAITISLDTAHGLIGTIAAGDHVDVLSGFLVDNATGRQAPVLRTLMQDVLVLSVPKSAGGGIGAATQTKDVTLRVSYRQAPKIAFAADNGKLWLALRPQNGNTVDAQTLVTLQSLLFDVKAIRRGR